MVRRGKERCGEERKGEEYEKRIEGKKIFCKYYEVHDHISKSYPKLAMKENKKKDFSMALCRCFSIY